MFPNFGKGNDQAECNNPWEDISSKNLGTIANIFLKKWKSVIVHFDPNMAIYSLANVFSSTQNKSETKPFSRYSLLLSRPPTLYGTWRCTFWEILQSFACHLQTLIAHLILISYWEFCYFGHVLETSEIRVLIIANNVWTECSFSCHWYQ